MLLDSGTLRASVAINKVTNALNKRANLENGKLGGKKVFITTPGSESALNYPCQINDISTPNYIAYSHSAQKNAIKSNNTEELSKSNQAALKFGIIKSLLENTQETEKFNFSENELSLLMEYAFDQNKEIPDDLFHEENAMLQFSHEKLKEKIIQLQNSQILAEISENSSSFNKDDISDSLSYVPVDPYAEYRGDDELFQKVLEISQKEASIGEMQASSIAFSREKTIEIFAKKGLTHFTNNGGTHESGKTKNNCLIISIVEHLICLFKNSGTLQKSREDYVNDFRRRLNEKFPELAENNLGITEEHGKTLIEMIAEEFKINLTINHIEVIPDRLFSESLNPPYIENHINSTFIFERGDSIIVPVLNCETHFEGFLPKTSLD